MKKKQYISPRIDVIVLKNQQSLLTESNPDGVMIYGEANESYETL